MYGAAAKGQREVEENHGITAWVDNPSEVAPVVQIGLKLVPELCVNMGIWMASPNTKCVIKHSVCSVLVDGGIWQ